MAGEGEGVAGAVAGEGEGIEGTVGFEVTVVVVVGNLGHLMEPKRGLIGGAVPARGGHGPRRALAGVRTRLADAGAPRPVGSPAPVDTDCVETVVLVVVSVVPAPGGKRGQVRTRGSSGGAADGWAPKTQATSAASLAALACASASAGAGGLGDADSRTQLTACEGKSGGWRWVRVVAAAAAVAAAVGRRRAAAAAAATAPGPTVHHDQQAGQRQQGRCEAAHGEGRRAGAAGVLVQGEGRSVGGLGQH